jgi:prephenate dehydratase
VAGLKVAIQGERGAFSHAAALVALGPGVEIKPCPTFDALFEAARSGAADRALVPIENSLHGSIHENYDRLSASPLHIVGETQLRVEQCLIARPGTKVDSLERVASHPVALAQCRRFFAEHPKIEPVTAYDTAGAVQEMLKGGGSPQDGAIASRLAAEIYGGEVLMAGIEDDPQNFTRFLVLARDAGPLAAANKTSVVFTLQHVPGALYRAIGVFANRGVDLAKIESRPYRGRPWEYEFYLDVIGDPAGPAGEALEKLAEMSGEFRVLGSYPDGLTRFLAASTPHPENPSR